jgi:hypothetical protein
MLILIILVIAIFAAYPVMADHRYAGGNHFNNHQNGYYNHNGGNYNRWHQPRRHNHNYYRHNHRRGNNNIAGVIIGGIILNEIFRNNNQYRQYRQCHDVRRSGYDYNGNQVIYYERVCN